MGNNTIIKATQTEADSLHLTNSIVNPNTLVEVSNYTKKFKTFKAVDKISFNVDSGSIHGFIGPNGAGKTTTIKALIGAYTFAEGKMDIHTEKGIFRAGTKEAKAEIGYIPERASFPKEMNCMQYLKMMASLNGFKGKASTEKALELLKSIGLEKHAFRKPHEFSSGMKKKVLIAQALMSNPRILVLDEPAANLDPSARKELFDLLVKLRDEGKSVFISSHILTELQEIVDSVTIIFQGRVRYSGSSTIDTDEVHYKFRAGDRHKLADTLKGSGFDVLEIGDTSVTIDLKDEKNLSKVISSISATGERIDLIQNMSSSIIALYEKLEKKYGTVSGVGNESADEPVIEEKDESEGEA